MTQLVSSTMARAEVQKGKGRTSPPTDDDQGTRNKEQGTRSVARVEQLELLGWVTPFVKRRPCWLCALGTLLIRDVTAL